MYYVHGNIYGNYINQYESIYINYIVLHSNIYSLLYILTPGNPKRDVCDVMLAVNHQPNFVPQIHVKSQCLQRQKYLQPWMFLDTITPPQIWGSPSIMIFRSRLSNHGDYADIFSIWIHIHSKSRSRFHGFGLGLGPISVGTSITLYNDHE